MLFDKSFGRKVQVDVLDGSGLRKTECTLIDDPTIYTRMPYGDFQVRVRTNRRTQVDINLDGSLQRQCQVDPGEHLFVNSDDGSNFIFRDPAEPAPVAVANSEKPVQRTLFNNDTLVDEVEDAAVERTNGLLMVSVRTLDGNDATNEPPADKVSTVIFQMNPPDLHDQMVAANLHRLDGPESPTHTCLLAQ